MATRKGSDNRFPLLRLTYEDDTPATPPSGEGHLVAGVDKVLRYIDDDGLTVELGSGTVAELDDVGDVNAPTPSNGDVLTWDSTPGEWIAAAPAGGGGTPILATMRYAPGSDTSIATTTSATQGDVDATNAKVTAVVPASGSVMIRVACAMTTTSNQNAFWGIRQGSTNLIGPTLMTSDNNLNVMQRWFKLTGLTPGSQDFKMAFSVAGGATQTLYGGPTSGPLEMDVWAL